MKLEDVAAKLGKVTWVNHPSLGRMLRASCPAHPDKKPSLAWWEGADGWLHCKCQTGCSEDAIMGALGMSTEDRRVEAPKLQSVKDKNRTYTYTDKQGKPRFRKVIVGHGAEKQARIEHYDGERWKPGAGAPDWKEFLYRECEIDAAVRANRTVFVCNGEKAADAVRTVGGFGTCQPQGEGPGKWLECHTSSLAGADVVVVADIDEVGEAYAREVFQSLAGVAKSAKVVQSKTGQPKDDAYDHVAAGYMPDEFVRRVDLEGEEPLETEQVTEADIERLQIDFVWEPYFRKGKCCLVDADGGVGKTSLMAAVCACLSVGQVPWAPERTDPINILYLHKGEDENEEIGAVFAANGGDLNRFRFYSKGELYFDPRGLAKLKSTINKGIDGVPFSLVVVDALYYFLPGTVNPNAPDQVQPVIQRLNAVMSETGCACANVRHTNKAANAKDGNVANTAAGLGTVAFRNSHRGQIVMKWHPDRKAYPGVVVVTDEKGSLLVAKGDPFAFRRVGLEVVQVKVPDLVEGESPPRGYPGRPSSGRSHAKDFILSTLKPGPMPASTVLSLASDAGISIATLYRAKDALMVLIEKDRDGVSHWSLQTARRDTRQDWLFE